MFKAKKSNEYKLYATFIQDIINGCGDCYINMFCEAIKDAQNLRRTQDYYNVPRPRYDLIVKLSEFEPILDIDLDNVTKEIWIDIKNFLES